jgi:hypothetical protein
VPHFDFRSRFATFFSTSCASLSQSSATFNQEALAAVPKALSDCLRQSSAFLRNSSAALIALAELVGVRGALGAFHGRSRQSVNCPGFNLNAIIADGGSGHMPVTCSPAPILSLIISSAVAGLRSAITYRARMDSPPSSCGVATQTSCPATGCNSVMSALCAVLILRQ